MSEIDPKDDVTDDKTTVIAPHEAIGLDQVNPVIVIIWLESKSNYCGEVTAEVSKNGLEHGGNTTLMSTTKGIEFPPSITTAYVAEYA